MLNMDEYFTMNQVILAQAFVAIDRVRSRAEYYPSLYLHGPGCIRALEGSRAGEFGPEIGGGGGNGT